MGPRRRHRLAVLTLFLLAVGSYLPSLSNRFAFDDTLARPITNDHGRDTMIAELHGPGRYFSAHYWEGELKHSRLYRPVTIWSYALTYHLLSKLLLPDGWPDGWEKLTKPELDRELNREALPHRISNLLLNGWAAYLAFGLMLGLGVGLLGSFLTAALFAVHALHSEVVAGIVGRAELFSFCFGAAALQVYIRGASPGLSKWAWRTVAAVLLFLALCSKESAIAWLPFIPCYLFARGWLARGCAATVVSWKDTLRQEVGPLLLVCLLPLVLFLVLRGIAIADWSEDIFYTANPLLYEGDPTRILTAIKMLGYAIYKCVVPFSPAAIYGPPAIGLVSTPLQLEFFAAFTVIAAWLFFALRRPDRTPLLFISIALFFGFSFLTSNVPFAIGTIFGERLYFIPSLGICMLPALLLPRLTTAGRRIVLGICAGWIVASSVVDVRRCPVWTDNVSLMLHDAEVQPNCASLQLKAADMHHWLRNVDKDRADFHAKEARRLLRRAQELDPDYVGAVRIEAEFLMGEKKFDRAIEVLRRALKMKRLPICGLESGLRTDLGMMLIKEKGLENQGVRELRRALELEPRRFPLPARLIVIDYGVPVLGREAIQKIIVEGQTIYPRSLEMAAAAASFVFDEGERTAMNANIVIDLLTDVFRALNTKDGQHHERFVKARLQLAHCLKAVGRVDEARQSYENLLSLEKATADQRKEARTALAELRR